MKTTDDRLLEIRAILIGIWVLLFIIAMALVTSCTAPAPVTNSLNDLMDVDLTGLDSGDILVRDGYGYIVVDGLWENQYQTGGVYEISDTSINGQTYLIGTK